MHFVLKFCDVIVRALSSLTIIEIWFQGNWFQGFKTYMHFVLQFCDVIVRALSSSTFIEIWFQGYKTNIHLFNSFVM